MKKLLVYFLLTVLLASCNADPTVEMSALAIKQYLGEKTDADIEVFVVSHYDADGDFNNLQRELTVQFVLPASSNLTEVTLPNGLMLKRGIRSSGITALVVHSKDNASWKATKVELTKNK